MATGESEDALREQVPQRVLDLPRLPIIHEATRETVDQSVAFFRRFEQDRAAIGARLRLIESRDEGFVEEVREENSLWYRVAVQHKRLRSRKSSVLQQVLRRGGVCISPEIGSFTNNAG